MTSILKKTLSNKILQYVFSRYLIYFIQFINSLLIAVYLGPFYLGVWGFINLAIQYFEQFNFGLSQSFNALGSIHKQHSEYVGKLFVSTLICIGIVAGIAVVFLWLNQTLDFGFGEKYGFSKFAPVVAIVVMLNYFLPAFLNLLRIYGNVLTIAIVQSLQPLCVFLALHFWKGEKLLDVLVWALLLSSLASILIYLYKMPIRIPFNIEFSSIKTILRKALFLFLYSASFYFILLSTKGLISSNYSVEQFGFFTFSFSLGNAILLLFKSFIFLVFPKVINRLAHSQPGEAMSMLNSIRADYTTLSHTVGHLAILLFPVFIVFFPQFSDTIWAFNYIVMSLIVYTHCFGYQELLIAKGKDKGLGVIAFLSLLVNVCVALFLIKVVNVGYQYVILSTMVAYSFFLLLLNYRARKMLDVKLTARQVFAIVFPTRLLIPFLVSLALSSYQAPIYYFTFPMLVFLLINRTSLASLKTTFFRILNNPKIVDI